LDFSLKIGYIVSLEWKKFSSDYFSLPVDLLTNKTLKHNFLHVFENWWKMQAIKSCSTGCPTRYRTRHFFNNFSTNVDIATKFGADLPHYVRNVKEKNVLLFKFHCNVFIDFRIIKEMPGSVASGTPCTITVRKYMP
jgi:hypothetical protein